ncbi:hypothetical protein CC78DRAFT_189964 [Lojkania enalia]|uniref:Uncharacterized protein n=1 Tax=Lojkania enalia TaxID=147567 RepID=A0A9P4TQZ0_9PLEO|nr:hypothetical protein CC78DRAFT_189964 [Didymosphaeria enalia]
MTKKPTRPLRPHPYLDNQYHLGNELSTTLVMDDSSLVQSSADTHLLSESPGTLLETEWEHTSSPQILHLCQSVTPEGHTPPIFPVTRESFSMVQSTGYNNRRSVPPNGTVTGDDGLRQITPLVPAQIAETILSPHVEALSSPNRGTPRVSENSNIIPNGRESLHQAHNNTHAHTWPPVTRANSDPYGEIISCQGDIQLPAATKSAPPTPNTTPHLEYSLRYNQNTQVCSLFVASQHTTPADSSIPTTSISPTLTDTTIQMAPDKPTPIVPDKLTPDSSIATVSKKPTPKESPSKTASTKPTLADSSTAVASSEPTPTDSSVPTDSNKPTLPAAAKASIEHENKSRRPTRGYAQAKPGPNVTVRSAHRGPSKPIANVVAKSVSKGLSKPKPGPRSRVMSEQPAIAPPCKAPELIPSAEPISLPGDPVVNLRVQGPTLDAQGNLIYADLKVRASQLFGPHLHHFCEERGKKWIQDWVFVYWFPAPKEGSPNNMAGVVLMYDHSVRGFDRPDIPLAKMHDGSVIECMNREDLMRYPGAHMHLQPTHPPSTAIPYAMLYSNYEAAFQENARLFNENNRLHAENRILRRTISEMQSPFYPGFSFPESGDGMEL